MAPGCRSEPMTDGGLVGKHYLFSPLQSPHDLSASAWFMDPFLASFLFPPQMSGFMSILSGFTS